MNRNRKATIAILASGLILSSTVGVSSSSALTAAVIGNHQASITAMEQYKIDYAAYKLAIAAWNVTRTQQLADFMTARNAYLALQLSNQTARLEIAKEKNAAITAANAEYAAQILKASTAASKKGLLTARNSKIAAAVAQAKRGLAALPVLGPKQVWPVASPRPVKPIKPVTS